MSHDITKLNFRMKRVEEQIENLLSMLRAQSMAFVNLKAELNKHADPPNYAKVPDAPTPK